MTGGPVKRRREVASFVWLCSVCLLILDRAKISPVDGRGDRFTRYSGFETIRSEPLTKHPTTGEMFPFPACATDDR